MSSIARARSVSAPLANAESSVPGSGGVADLLRANALNNPQETAFVDQSRREDWSGRSRIDRTFESANRTAEQLAGFFASLGLPSKALVGVCLPNGSEAPLVLAALDRAGLTACLMPVAWSKETLSALVEDLGIACVITQACIGQLRPAETWREIAAGYFGLRFILAFGPSVPDGVIDLDRIIVDDTKHAEPWTIESDDREGGYVSFELRNGAPRPTFRSWASAIAAARVFLSAAQYERGDRIVALLAQDDHRSLTTGLVSALLTGASIEFHGLFSSAALAQSLNHKGISRIVAPGWMEADLARLDLGMSVRSVILVHQAPVRFKARTPLTLGVIDVLAFGEVAVLAKARSARGQFALSLDTPQIEDAASQTQLLDVRRDEGGHILFNGLAAQTSDVGRQGIGETEQGWRPSGYTADMFAGIVIGVS